MSGLPSPQEAAKTLGSRKSGFGCWVCQHHEAKEWLDKYMDALEGGGARIPVSNIADLFRAHLGMPHISDTGVGGHLRNHTEGRWRAINRG